MNQFLQWIETKMMPPLVKVGDQRHIRSIRMGIVAAMPLVLIGSILLLLVNIPIPAVAHWLSPYVPRLVVPYQLTMGLMAVYATFAMGYHLAKSYELDGLNGGLWSVAAFFMLNIPLDIQGTGWVLPMESLGGGGLFSGILAMLFAVEVIHFFAKYKIKVKMPGNVPPAVAASFEAVIPGAVIILVVWTVRVLFDFDVNQLLSYLFQPLVNVLGNNLLGVLVPIIFIHLTWASGIHGMAIIGTFVRPMWYVMLSGNMAAVAGGADLSTLPYIAPEQFYQWTVLLGGAGATLSLSILLLFTAKSEYLKSMGKLSFLPGIFNINETMIFGVPLVMNPIMSIPFLLAPTLVTIVSYYAVKLGLVNGFSALVPWTLPAPIGAFLATGNDWRAIVLVLVNLFIGGMVYYPFVKVLDGQMRKIEEKERSKEDDEIFDGN